MEAGPVGCVTEIKVEGGGQLPVEQGGEHLYLRVLKVQEAIAAAGYLRVKALRNEWRALVDDFRTLPIGQLVAEIPVWTELRVS